MNDFEAVARPVALPPCLELVVEYKRSVFLLFHSLPTSYDHFFFSLPLTVHSFVIFHTARDVDKCLDITAFSSQMSICPTFYFFFSRSTYQPGSKKKYYTSEESSILPSITIFGSVFVMTRHINTLVSQLSSTIFIFLRLQ